MLRPFSRPLPLGLLLAFLTALPVVMALVRLVEIPLGLVPEDSLRLTVAPIAMFLHALCGAAFGILGPVQFIRVLQRRPRWHRLTGRVFALAGLGLGLSGHALLWQVTSTATPVMDVSRGVFGTALIIALALGVAHARARDLPRHRAWMIRAYAIGMGTTTIGLVFFPIYLVTGAPPRGLGADLIFAGWWVFNIALAEAVIRRLPQATASAMAAK